MARILLVDENPVTRMISRKSLLLAGHRVVDAATGASALEALAAATFDGIVLDLAISDIDGIELLERIAATPRHERTPVVAIAESPEQDPATLAALAGSVVARVPKPFGPGELTEAVARALAVWAEPAGEDRIVLPDAQPTPERQG